MSLVGTRPILQDELLKYELHHRARIAIKKAIADGVTNMAASCSLMQKYGFTTYFSKGSEKNIKIRTYVPLDDMKAENSNGQQEAAESEENNG